MKHITLLILLGGIVPLLAACGPGQPATPVSEIARGERLFNRGNGSSPACVACHSLDGSKLVGPSLRGIGSRAATRAAGQTTDEYLRQSIVAPSAVVVEGYPDGMVKDYGKTLSREDIDALVAFLLTQ